MNTVVSHSPAVTSADRLGLTLFFALALHAIVIFGVSFDILREKPGQDLPTMEVTLVHSRSDEAPKHADYLAQANQRGGGNVEEKVRPSSPFSNPNPTTDNGVAPDSRPVQSLPQRRERPKRELLTATRAPTQVPSEREKEPLPLRERDINVTQLIERSREIARLSADIRERQEAYAQKPRETFISGANAREYRLAAYMDAWRVKVERIGNLNYPDEARREKLSGNLLLDVAINADGTIHSVQVLRSSGYQVLDDAAKRIVHMAAPYAPLSAAIRKDTDILHIIRTWQFESADGGSGLHTFTH